MSRQRRTASSDAGATSRASSIHRRRAHVYPGVDLVFHGGRGQIEYDFVVAPGAEPRAIEVKFDGVDGLEVTPEGDLVLKTPVGELRQHRPIVRQESRAVSAVT